MLSSGSIESIKKLQEGQIAISHFNDSPEHPARKLQQDPDRIMPGDGIINLKRYCDLLREIGYRRWLSLELFNRQLWGRTRRVGILIGTLVRNFIPLYLGRGGRS